MTKRERCMAAVEGHESDRIPVGFWYHFPLEHPSGEPLAEAELGFAKKYDPDFLKIMHDLWLDLPDGLKLIEDPADWRKLRPLNPREGNFAEQLKALKLIRKGLKADMPVVDTVFDPYAAANKLCGKKIMEHLRADPESVKQGLRAITVSLADYSAAWIEEGGDGIFYALDGAQKSVMTRDEYQEIFLPLDKMVLNSAAEKGTFNVLHLHGEGIYFDMCHDLPNHVLNWSSRLTYPSLREARGIHQGCIANGINEMEILGKTVEEVLDEARRSIAEAGTPGFILTPGCAVPTETPEENLFALRQVVEM
ncbi:MAG TPA: uroporphyrinogen decarboxylase family protein [Armatimonadota bacterium]|nr:uroporphyrinogen decarboxylase family protein [Armatimonadota bacterium]